VPLKKSKNKKRSQGLQKEKLLPESRQCGIESILLTGAAIFTVKKSEVPQHVVVFSGMFIDPYSKNCLLLITSICPLRLPPA
jgi:hypothetical protein